MHFRSKILDIAAKFLLAPSASPCNETIQFKSTENSSASINHSVSTSEVIEL